jgi:hypothetical protein
MQLPEEVGFVHVVPMSTDVKCDKMLGVCQRATEQEAIYVQIGLYHRCIFYLQDNRGSML